MPRKDRAELREPVRLEPGGETGRETGHVSGAAAAGGGAASPGRRRAPAPSCAGAGRDAFRRGFQDQRKQPKSRERNCAAVPQK